MPYYDSIAGGYDELHKDEQLNKLSIIKKALSVKKSEKMLDVGCGTGVSSEFDCFVAGIDTSLELLKLNKSKNKSCAAAESLPFKDNSFDYVVSVTAMHNFNDIKKSIAEIKRVGKNKFIFSILKKSSKLDSIKKSLEKNFEISREIEEEKDIIFFCNKQFY